MLSRGLPNLERLEIGTKFMTLDRNNVNSEGIRHLSRNLGNLRHLSIGGNVLAISDRNRSYKEICLRLTKLEELLETDEIGGANRLPWPYMKVWAEFGAQFQLLYPDSFQEEANKKGEEARVEKGANPEVA